MSYISTGGRIGNLVDAIREVPADTTVTLHLHGGQSLSGTVTVNPGDSVELTDTATPVLRWRVRADEIAAVGRP